MIGVIDYNSGNFNSVIRMLERSGIKAEMVSDANSVGRYKHLILPGVGAFDKGIQRLKDSGMYAAIVQHFDDGKPLLGICLGAQLFFEGSEEGTAAGFGLVMGRCALINPNDSAVKVPHMGWNEVSVVQPDPLFSGIDEPRFYFLHSYCFRPTDPTVVSSLCSHGIQFPASYRVKNLFGAQFHPEKSHRTGMQFLTNFARLEI
jgi:glutamine amidotransferase